MVEVIRVAASESVRATERRSTPARAWVRDMALKEGNYKAYP